jgi:hypothetical protein
MLQPSCPAQHLVYAAPRCARAPMRAPASSGSVAANSVLVAPQRTVWPWIRAEAQVSQEVGRRAAVFHSPGVDTTPGWGGAGRRGGGAGPGLGLRWLAARQERAGLGWPAALG